MLTRLEFDHLVEDLETKYRGRAPALTRIAVCWAILGYTFLLIGLLGSLAVFLACLWLVIAAPNFVTIKIGIVLGLSSGIIAWSILRGIWVKLSAPQGRVLSRAEAPRLFEMIDSTAEKAGGINFNRVLLTDDLNACVVQVPLLGIFGFYRNYLCIGLPLLDALSREEFHAVIAHEFAHLSKSHGRTGNWLYRIRSSWENVAHSISEQNGLLVRPFQTFFYWFWPRFNARAFVLSRLNEYEADAFSASVTSPETAGAALQRIAVEARRLDHEVWGKLQLRSFHEPEPPKNIYQEIAGMFKTPVDPKNASRWLGERLMMLTGTGDTHPSLRDRLAAMAVSPRTQGQPVLGSSAADELLDREFGHQVRADYSQIWTQTQAHHWKESHEESLQMRDRVQALSKEPQTANVRWEMLRLKGILEGMDQVTKELQDWLDAKPDHLLCRYMLGNHLLTSGDGSGLAHINQVAEASPNDTLRCLGIMADYHDRRGEHDEIIKLKRRADEHDSTMAAAAEERQQIGAHDTYISHGLDEEKLDAHRKVLAAHPEVQQAWIVRKQNRIFPAWPHHVFVVRLKYPTLKLVTDSTISTTLNQLVVALDEENYLTVISDSGGNKAVAAAITGKFPGSSFYRKES